MSFCHGIASDSILIPEIYVEKGKITFDGYITKSPLSVNIGYTVLEAVVDKGRWTTVKRQFKGPGTKPKEHFLKRFFDHCTGKKSYWLYDFLYDIEHWKDRYFTISCKGKNMPTFFRFEENLDITVLAVSTSWNILKIGSEEDPETDKYILVRKLVDK